MKNFVIAYDQRVGSSALVSSLANIDNFKVPVFEDLDAYFIKSSGQSEAWNEGTIHNLVDETFAKTIASNPGCAVGFKWRVWGGVEQVAAVLCKYDATVFNLVRSNWLEFVSSLYMTNVVYSDSNAPQFMLNKLSVEERADLLKKYRENVVDLNVAAFLELSDSLFWKETKRIERLEKLQALGVPVYTIYYEDFAYKNFHFMSKLTEVLGGEALKKLPRTSFKKVSSPFPSESFTNRAELLGVPKLIETIIAWKKAVHDGPIKPLPL